MEKDIEKKLVRGVREAGGIAFKFVSPGQDGVPDRLVCLPGGRIIFVELKTEVGRLSPRQKIQIGRLTALGMDCRVLYGRQQVEDFLKEVRQWSTNHTATS